MAGFSFSVAVPSVQEETLPGETAEACTLRLARAKAGAVRLEGRGSRCVLGADTVVALDGILLGKPSGPEEAIEMLLRLAGRCHRVVTGFAILAQGHDGLTILDGTEESRVQMGTLSHAQATRYVATGEPLDKAGSYALQGRGGELVEKVEGSRSNVIGLPLERVLPLLEQVGVRPA